MATPYYDKINSSWKIKVKQNGKWISRTLAKGEPSEQVPENILELAEPFMVKATATETEDANNPTLDGYCDLYLIGYQTKRPTSLIRLKVVLKTFKAILGPKTPLNEITVKRINEYVAQRVANGVAHSTIASDLAMLSGMFTLAVEESIIPFNPTKSAAKRVRKAVQDSDGEDEGDGKVTYYTKEQQRRILAALDLNGRSKYSDVVRIMLATGMRINAIVNLDFKWIDADGFIRIPRKFDKAKSGYTTYLFGDDAKAVVAKRREILKHGNVFPELTCYMVSNYLKRFYISHNLPDVAAMGHYNHVFRHTFATNRVDDGMSIEVLAKFMGHHDIRTTQVYAKVSIDNLKAAVAMIESRY